MIKQEIQPTPWLQENPPYLFMRCTEDHQEVPGWGGQGAGEEVGDPGERASGAAEQIQCPGLIIHELCDLRQAT